MIKLPKIVPPPEERPSHLPPSTKWLSGEGAGSWFLIEKEDSKYKITRFSPGGRLECEGVFKTDNAINLNSEYILSYPSHCSMVTVIQNMEKIVFKVV